MVGPRRFPPISIVSVFESGPGNSALRWIFLVHLICWFTVPSASVSRMHACHFELLLDLIMVPIFWNSWTDPLISMFEDKMLLKYDDNLGTKRSTELSIVQVIDFPFWVNRRVSPFSTHMNIRVLSKAYEAIESLAFHRAIALLRTDRDHEQKLVLARLLCTAPGRVNSLMELLDLLKVSHCII